MEEPPIMENLYYNPEKFGMTMITFDQPGLSYEFNTLAFWANQDGVVYAASSSGCSCPSPFEEYSSLQELERVSSAAHAVSIFNSWGGSTDLSDKRKLREWVEEKLCPIVERCLQDLAEGTT